MLLAALVCAWFVVGIRQTHDTAQAVAIVSSASALTAQQAAHVESLLSSAGTLNPDNQLELLRGRVALLQNQRARAISILQDLVRREPLNIEGWIWLAVAAGGRGTVYRQAIANVQRLDSAEFKRTP